MTAPTTRTVGISIFEDVEAFDFFCGPFEAFSVAGRHGETSDESRLFRWYDRRDERILLRGGLLFSRFTRSTMIRPSTSSVIPGVERDEPGADRRTRCFSGRIAAQAAKIERHPPACAQEHLLAKVGLLDGKAATTHWGSIHRPRDNFPQVDVRDDALLVDHGNIISSAWRLRRRGHRHEPVRHRPPYDRRPPLGRRGIGISWGTWRLAWRTKQVEVS